MHEVTGSATMSAAKPVRCTTMPDQGSTEALPIVGAVYVSDWPPGVDYCPPNDPSHFSS